MLFTIGSIGLLGYWVIYIMLLTVLVFFIVLSILVLVHEFGHFTAAKKLGIKVEEFGLGLPPRIFGWKFGETVYSVNWLPIGGFVKLFGEEGEEDVASSNFKAKSPKWKKEIKTRAFYSRPVWQRGVVLVAGVTMNFLLAITVISYLFTQGVPVPVQRVHISYVSPDSPAGVAGIKEKDILLSINDLKVSDTKTFQDEVKKNLGKEITLKVLRGSTLKHTGKDLEACVNCSELIIKLIPRVDPPFMKVPEVKKGVIGSMISDVKNYFHIPEIKSQPPREGALGIGISNYEVRFYTWYEAPIYGLSEAITLSKEGLKGIITIVWKMISFQPVGKDVAGPIGIAQMTGLAVKSGINSVLELLGLLSLNLAIVNILPFPALDGGRFLFVVIEAITGKKIKTNWERYIHQVGMIILLLLMVLVTLNDLVRIVMG